MNGLLTPGTLMVALLGVVLVFAPLAIVAYEEKNHVTTPGSKITTWLFFHSFESILMVVGTTLAVWRFEHGHSWGAIAECYILPGAFIAGSLLRRLTRSLRERFRRKPLQS